ncbi:carbohydrate ABC transporter permease [Paenibacillus faecalis]|uniref:carbohydrate ABC transporter permease n=1 Tax=Paenibacillus faecalis TaxID=2079532 RepID=UPI000D100020|nr:carbohydrate ABC transporter permease [Paenibacillus faecalis]
MSTSIWKLRLGKGLLYAFLILVAVICIVPFYSMIVTSTHSNSDIARTLPLWIGEEFSNNYGRLMEAVNIWRGFLNSVIIAVSSTALGVYFSALAGYGFAKFRFKGSKWLFMFVLGTMMIPGQLGIIGFFRLISGMDLLNTYWPLILPSIANAFGIFFLKQYVDGAVPNEIIESGRVDGCRELKMFHRLIFPIMMPGIATLAIFIFIGKWNSFLEPMIILFENHLQPLPVMIAGVKTQFNTDYGAQYVGILISVLPILVFFSLASKKVISGVAAGAVKE